SSCEAEIYAGAISAQELPWLTYLLTDLGEQPHSPPVLYQRGQLRLAYVATRANTADVFTKALPPSDHQRFSTVLGLSRCPALPCPACHATLLAAAPPLAAHAPPLAAHAPPFAARRAALCSPGAAICSPRAALCNPRAALLLPTLPYPRAALLAAAPPFAAHAPPLAAHSPPLAARAPPFAPARRPAAGSSAGRRPPARTALLRAALLLAPPNCCSPCCAQPCWPAPSCPRHPAAAHPAVRRPAGRRPAARVPRCCPCAALLAVAPPCPSLRAPLVLYVVTFDHEGRLIQFDTWLDDLQLYLLSDSRDSVLLFDHTSGASLAPPATADSVTRSQWLTRDDAARLAVRNHLPLAKRAHFGQHKTAKALYDAVVARYSSPATAALGRLILPYLFPELSAFATVEDLVTHLRTSDARYRAALPAEFLDRNPPPMNITLYFIVTRLPNSLRAARDHFLALDPTDLTIDLLEKHLLVAETSVVAVGAARDTPCTPFFEGCSPSPLAPPTLLLLLLTSLVLRMLGLLLLLVGSAVAARARVARVVAVAAGVVVVEAVEAVEVAEVVAAVGVVAGVGASVAVVVAVVGVAVVAAVGVVAAAVVAVRVELFRGEILAVARGSSNSAGARPLRPSSFTCGNFHSQHRCFSRLDDAWRAEFGDEAERPRWSELLRSGVDIFALDYDAILAAMYALSVSAEGDCYLCVPLDPGIEAAALGASEFALPGTAPAEALHTFTLDSGASRCFFRDSTTLTPLPAPVPVRLADPSGGPVLARSSTVLPCLVVPSDSLSGLHLPLFSTNFVSTAALQDSMVTTTTPGGQRVSICTCTRTGCHLAMFTHRPGSSLYTLTTEPPQVAASTQVSTAGPVAAPFSCRLLSHQTLLWHHRLGHPSLPRLRGMHSRLLVSGLLRSLL
ncbi:unnamed protein product, partial [Closterium sp. NIES-53]